MLHFTLHSIGLVFAILLMVSLIQHQNRGGEVYFASFHAWLSIVLIVGYIIQVDFNQKIVVHFGV
jgi:hypothetical protein